MIKCFNIETYGWDAAIRGMRNPMNSWDKSDSEYDWYEDPSPINPNDEYRLILGENDLCLMKRLVSAGTDHSKFMRFITVTLDVIAPLYWWKEYDTYKVGTVANSCSTMHKIHSNAFTIDDFSSEHLFDGIERNDSPDNDMDYYENPMTCLEYVIRTMNYYRQKFIDTKDKRYWWQMIQLLPSSYNQRRTLLLNYQVLTNIYHARKNHKLDEWHDFCCMIESLPYSELITQEF